MVDLLRLTLLTPAKVGLDVAAVTKVRFKLADGVWLSIYPHHLPLIAETLAGPLTYTIADESHTVDLASGIVHVADNVVTLFTGGPLGAPVAETLSTSVTEQEFDRLAQTLFMTLAAHVEDVTL